MEIHSGPKALALSDDGKTLGVLNRFTGTLAWVDLSNAGKGGAAVRGQLPLLPTILSQRQRRLGQVLYYADFGKSGMSCDACHLEGHTGGVFLTKTHPMRIYRSTSIRGARETPPYFTPASTRSMAETSKTVGNRNRFHNLDLTPEEVEALTVFSSAFTTLPNPFVGEDGAPQEAALELPDGERGRPRVGMALFEEKGRCAGCHPPPQFTLDQDPATRGQFLDVGTPHGLPLRVEMQDLLLQGLWHASLGWRVGYLPDADHRRGRAEGRKRCSASSKHAIPAARSS